MRAGALLLAAALGAWPSAVTAQTAAQSQASSAAGRVVGTVTTLEGTLCVPAAQVELRAAGDRVALAKTTTDATGQVDFPDVPPGRYVLSAARAGFMARDSAPFEVRAGDVARVLLDIPLTFTPPAVEVRASSPTDSVQPVSISDMLAGSALETAPLPGDDFQSLLPLLPGVVRGPDGRLRIKGGRPTQGAIQISSASLNDPSTGDFNVEVPGASIESVEVLANPFAAEYGRFSTSVTQIRTRRGTDTWQIVPGSMVPRFRKWFSGVRVFEPQVSIRGPLAKDRLFVAQDFQFRHVTASINTPREQPEMRMRSFDSFTRLDAILSTRHMLGATVVSFPREIMRATMTSFRPAETTQRFVQDGLSVAFVDRFALTSDVAFDTTLAARWFEIETGAAGSAPMVYWPDGQSGNFFNDQEREVETVQWVQALTLTRRWRGDHVVKLGTDLQHSHFDGRSVSRPVELRRMDGSLAERTVFRGGEGGQQVSGVEFGMFVQDRWRVGPRVTFELGLRADRDVVVERFNWSPRAGVAVSVLPEGRAIVRGGFGTFVQRTPLNVAAFPAFEWREVTRFDPSGVALTGMPVRYTNTLDPDLRTPRARVGNLEWNQRFGRRVLLKLAFMGRRGSHEAILSPRADRGDLYLSSTGRSRYRELEATTRYLGGDRRDLTFSYVWSKGTADLNDYDQFFGNFRNPVVRRNEYGLSATDVRHRLLVRGTIGLPGGWDFAPVLELRSGFPWSAVDEFQDAVGPRNRAGRLPAVRTLDFSLSRPWQIRRHRVRLGVKLFNVFGASAERDVQNNVSGPAFGSFYNPIERSIGFVFSVLR
ncbi:MAG TPA: TonB-dependent receptor [Vicinamibacterales bacterium]|nr:TonB-dependent receptor [Vicinamibacterales bacterium]